jgi:hypothetical protein
MIVVTAMGSARKRQHRDVYISLETDGIEASGNGLQRCPIPGAGAKWAQSTGEGQHTGARSPRRLHRFRLDEAWPRGFRSAFIAPSR